MINITNGLLIAFAIFNVIFALSLKNQMLLRIKQEDCPMNYVVNPGDTLTVIAFRFRTTIDDLIRENNINDPNSITEGNILRIPCKTETPTEIPATELSNREENMTSRNITEYTENRNLTNLNISESLGLFSENMTIVINVLNDSDDKDDNNESEDLDD